MMKLMWDCRHGDIFRQFTSELSRQGIRYFVLRNYEGLPDVNTAKDVDIVIEPGFLRQAREFLLIFYKKSGVEYKFETSFDRLHCIHGISIEDSFSIHIDLIEGYVVKGFEIFSFDELYAHTRWYHDFCVMDSFFDGVMLYIYKQFGYTRPTFKPEYTKLIMNTFRTYPAEFREQLEELTGKGFANETCTLIHEGAFDDLVKMSSRLTRKLQAYALKKRPFYTIGRVSAFLLLKLNRIVFHYRKYEKSFAVLAPDGAGKTTFLTALVEQLAFYYVNDANDGRFHIYHFRPGVMPNLGVIGEKAGLMVQDTNFTNPHRGKQVGLLSSLMRIAYYTLDYMIGWRKCVRDDVRYDRYSIFDRYSYDLIIDPKRTKLNLPESICRFFVALTPKPKIIFYLDADPEVIFARKQELTLEEICRQVGEYRLLAKKNPNRFVTINSEQTQHAMVSQALKTLLEEYTEKL